MTSHSLDLTEKELTLIYKLCENATVQGFETAQTLVSIIQKIQTVAHNNQLPHGQETLPLVNNQEYQDNA